MKTEWRDYLSVRAPRYTSYPSAQQFDSSVTADDYAGKLRAVTLYEPLSLYVHVPFCAQLCWYCGCNMKVENNYSRAVGYVESLVREIQRVGAALGGKGRPATVHFGGGTPNYLRAEELRAILQAIENEIGLTDDVPLAIELDPRLIREGDIDCLASLGFSRMSLGVQDFDPAVHQAINRLQSFEMVERCVGAIRTAGIDDLSFDILYGLPKQSAAGFAETMDKVAALSPDRVAVFGYAHLPDKLPRQRKIKSEDLPDDDLRSELAALAGEKLISAGYQCIGFDHYAKPHNSLALAARHRRLKRNFQGFTDDVAETVLGFGASAISLVDGLYAQNTKNLRDYAAKTARGELPVERGIVRTPHEAIIAKTIGDLLCSFEANIAEALAGAAPYEANRICALLEGLEANGVISWTDDCVRIDGEAHALARVVAMAFDPYARPEQEAAKAV